MLGLILLYVGAVLFINGLAMLGKVSTKEAAVINIFTGGLYLAISFNNAFSGEAPLIRACAYGLLFAFTFLWVAYNELTGQDGRGLGWFSLFVAVTAGLITIDQVLVVSNFAGGWLVYCWAAWTVLWGSFFALQVLGKKEWKKNIAYGTLFVALTAGWLPGYLLLSGHMPG